MWRIKRYEKSKKSPCENGDKEKTVDVTGLQRIEICIFKTITPSTSLINKGLEAPREKMRTFFRRTPPWQKSFEALRILMLSNNTDKKLLLKILPTIPAFRTEEQNIVKEQKIVVACYIMNAYIQLMHYEDAIQLFEAKDTQDYINDSLNSPFLKLKIYGTYISALSAKGDSAKIQQALKEQLKVVFIIENLQLDDDSWLNDNREYIISLLFLHDKKMLSSRS